MTERVGAACAWVGHIAYWQTVAKNLEFKPCFAIGGIFSIMHAIVPPGPAQVRDQVSKPTAIEFLEGQSIKVTLRDSMTLQGRLERIGWMNPDSEAISYICLKIEAESNYVLAAQGISTKSGILFLPWDWVAYVVVP